MNKNYLAYNRQAWNSQVKIGNRWTVPVSSETIELARQGNWSVVVTPTKPVPRDWFGDITGKQLLCLAGGGGQQAPILAAAGAHVTTFDNSELQLQQDQLVAEREGLKISSVQGDMADLHELTSDSFDIVLNPCSNCFVPELQPVWNEAARVLKPGGRLIAGWTNPLRFIFDADELEQQNLVVRHTIPYSDYEQLTDQELKKLIDDKEPLLFGHSLDDQIGGQLRAGLRMVAFFEDGWEDENGTLNRHIQDFCATCCEKPNSLDH